jgi:hypothetical protein
MILANVRSRLDRNDAGLVLRLVARGSAAELARAERTLADDGLDPLLDDPRLLSAMVESRQAAHASFALFAYVVVRHAMRRAGEDDRVLADYVAAVLLHFGVRERAERISDSDDQSYTTLAELSGDVGDADPRRAFLVRAHLGNYALWRSGLFPDLIEHRRWRRGGPDLDYYETMGRRGFELAAGHRLASEHGLSALFDLAARRFGVLRMALNRVSDTMLFPDRHSPDRLLRQVRDESRWKQAS